MQKYWTLLNHETAKQNSETPKRLFPFPCKFGIQEADITPADHVCNILEYGLHEAFFKEKDFLGLWMICKAPEDKVQGLWQPESNLSQLARN